ATRSVVMRATDSQGDFVEQTFILNVLDSEEFTLTTGSDMLAASAANTQVRGNALTFNAGDDLDGGDGFDSLVLFGGGTFDLNSLANFAGFEEVRVVNITGTPIALTLRDGTTTDVAIDSSAPTSINLLGTTSAGSIIGSDGSNTISLSDSSTAGNIIG